MKLDFRVIVLLLSLLLPSSVWAESLEEYGVVFLSRDQYPVQHPWISDLDGTDATELAPVDTFSPPKISQGIVVFMAHDFEGQGRGIYKMEATPGAPVEKIPNTGNIHRANSSAIDLSPDGSRVVFSGFEPGDRFQNHNIYVINIDGSEKTRIYRDTSRHHFNISWSEPDRILLSVSSVYSAISQRIHEIRPDGSGLKRVYGPFAQRAHGGGPNDQVVLTVTQRNPKVATADRDFTNVDLVPGPVTGYRTFLSWNPLSGELLGTKSGSLVKIDPATGTESVLTAGGSSHLNGFSGGTDVGLRISCTFGPEDPLTFVRRRGAPTEEFATWESCGGEGTLRILNHRNAAAIVHLNGHRIATTSDFSAVIDTIEVPVALLEGENVLFVELRSKPTSRLTFEFIEATED